MNIQNEIVHNFILLHIFKYLTIKHSCRRRCRRCHRILPPARRIWKFIPKQKRKPKSNEMIWSVSSPICACLPLLTWENHNIFPARNNKFHFCYCVFLLLFLLFIKCCGNTAQEATTRRRCCCWCCCRPMLATAFFELFLVFCSFNY